MPTLISARKSVTGLRLRMNEFLESSTLFNSIICLLIILSIPLILIDLSHSPVHTEAANWARRANQWILIAFAVEYTLRFWASGHGIKERLIWARTPAAIIDLLAIAPLLRPLRMMRLLRTARLFKLMRHKEMILRESAQGFYMVILAVSVAILMLSGMFLKYYFSPGDSPSDSFWWSFAKVASAGSVTEEQSGTYRAIGLVIGLSGLMAFGLFITISHSMFQTFLEKLRRGIGPMRMDGHALIVGYNSAVPYLVNEFREFQIPVGVLADRDTMPAALRELSQRKSFEFRTGPTLDIRSLTSRGSLTRASTVVVVADDAQDGLDGRALEQRDAKSVLQTMTVHARRETMRESGIAGPTIVAEAAVARNVTRLRSAGADIVVTPRSIGSRYLAQVARSIEYGTVIDELMWSEGKDLYMVPPPKALLGRPIDLESPFHEMYSSEIIPVGIATPSGPCLEPEWIRSSAGVFDEHTTLIVISDFRVPYIQKHRRRRAQLGQDYLDELAVATEGQAQRPRKENLEHCLIIGWNAGVPLIVEELRTFGLRSAVLVHGESGSLGIPGELRETAVFCDCRDEGVLEREGAISEAHSVLVLPDDRSGSDGKTLIQDADSVLAVMAARRALDATGPPAARRPPIVAAVGDPRNAAHLSTAGADHVVDAHRLSAFYTSLAARSPMLALVIDELLSSRGRELYMLCPPDDAPEPLSLETAWATFLPLGAIPIGFCRTHSSGTGRPARILIAPSKEECAEFGCTGSDFVIAISDIETAAVRSYLKRT